MASSLATLLTQFPRSRKASMVAFAVGLGALLLSAAWFTTARNALDRGYNMIGERNSVLVETRQRLEEARLRVKLAANASALVQAAESRGLVEQHWGERLINVTQAPLSREETNNLLSSIARDDNRIFGAEGFDLSVTRPEEGLFDAVDPRSPPLMLTMRGTLLFRTGGVDAVSGRVPRALVPAGEAP